MDPKGAKIIIYGDSITRYSMDPDSGCFASYLANELIGYYTLDIKGFAGFRTRDALILAPKLFTEDYLLDVHYFIIFFGHNDSWQDKFNYGISPSEYKDNLLIMVKLLLEDGMRRDRIMLITPGWHHEADWSEWQKRHLPVSFIKTFEHCIMYAEATQQVAQETGVTLIDWFKVTSNHEPLSELFSDGLHLSKRGAKLLFDTIWPELKSTIEKIHGKKMEQISIADIPKDLVDLIERGENFESEKSDCCERASKCATTKRE